MLYPIPNNHSEQKIELSWSAILRESETLFRPSLPPPSIRLDDIRRHLDGAAARRAKDYSGMNVLSNPRVTHRF